jgi:colanic acid/amylovoran biosynthesis glycosyltransferase
MVKQVAIYRHQLGKPSESFIYTPLPHYQTYKPILVGTEVWENKPLPVEHVAPANFTTMQRIIHRASFRNHYLENWFRQHQPDILHAHFAIDGLYASFFAHRYNIPLIVTLHGFDVTRTQKELLTSKNLSWIKYALNRKRLFRQCDRFLCVSQFIYEKALQAGFPQEKLTQHYIGVDTELFSARKGSAEPSEQFKILHVARLTEKKGTTFLLDAIKQMGDSAIKLTIAGDGELENTLKHQAAELGILNQIDFLGFVPYHEIQTLMQTHQVLCVPSVTATDGDAEGLGMVFLEAAACGLPIIATQHGGIPEAVIDGETGYLVRERDSEALANALNQIRLQPETCIQLGRQSRLRIDKLFNIKSNTECLEEIYDDVIAK